MKTTKTNDVKTMKIYAIGVLVIALLLGILSFVAFNKPASAGVGDESAVNLSLNDSALDKILGALGLGEAPAESVGAVSGPMMPFDHIQWGLGYGIRIYPTAIGLTTASTTVCAIQSPAATSTLQSAGILLTTASTSATTWSLGIASTAYATTTQIGSDYVVSASAQAFINASTTPSAGGVEVIAPNQYLVWSETGGITAGDAGTGFAPVGRCHATFESYSI
jgi:hypothetical protein